MKKQIVLLALVLVFCLSVPVAAAPTVDIPKGQISLNLTADGFSGVDHIWYYDLSKESISLAAVTASLTYGVTDDIAVTIGSQSFETVTEWYSSGFDFYEWEDAVSAFDIKLQKKLNNNTALFIGNKKFTWDNTLNGVTDTKSTNKFYGGLILNNELRKDVIGYASIGGGSGYTELAVGVNLLLSEHLELDLGYKSLTAKEIGAYPYDNNDISGNGFGIGLGLKF
jgi:hypothetical protein